MNKQPVIRNPQSTIRNIPSQWINQRLDYFLKEHFEFSRAYIQQLIRAGHIKVGQQKLKPSYHLKTGDEIVCHFPPPPENFKLQPEPIPLDILYEDKEVIVVNKPAGMVVHPATSVRSGTLVNALLYHCGRLSEIGILADRPGIVHRLDKDTSGILVVAKTNEAYWDLVNQFASRSINRIYLALVYGVVKEDEGEIDMPIGRHLRDRKKMGVVTARGKEAITRFKVSRRFPDFTLLEVKLATGRTHQIRVHLSYIHHPVVADATYGLKKTEVSLKRQALHARSLGFIHPTTKNYLEFVTLLPQDMADFIATLG
ncbi:MAG: RluA family pseudouridine synthase [bacterium]|nr:RluA family pseudouridine synthase [bacterium]